MLRTERPPRSLRLPDAPVASDEGLPAGDATASTDFTSTPKLDAVFLEHAYRGVRLQILLRAVLVAFVVLTMVVVPPEHDRLVSDLIAGIFAVWAVVIGAWTWRGGPAPMRIVWLDLGVDLAALTALTLLAGLSSEQSWTADLLVNGFFLVPLLAATQLHPAVTAGVVGPTVAVYFASSAATKAANGEPWGSIILRTLVLAGVGIGCIGLSYIQRSRVSAISRLVRDRSGLLGELTTIEARERRDLAEALHDGALQYVLAARHDLEDARETADPEAFARLDRALTESSRLLRSTVTELHPAVLEQAGLPEALRDLARSAGESGGFSAELDLDGWSEELRTTADSLLYSTARELMSNIVKHAHARTVHISLARRGQLARLVIADDGRGIPDGSVDRSVRKGHIGLASHRVRVEAAGGTLTLSPAEPSGTLATVVVPHAAKTDR